MLKNKTWIALLMAVVLSACGGDFDNDSDENENNSGDDSTEPGGDQGVDEVGQGSSLSIGSISGDSFEEGILLLATDTLSANGQTSVTVNLVLQDEDGFEEYSGSPLLVQFSSQCTDSDQASFTNESVVTTDSSVVTTYIASGCFGEDVIIARVEDLEAFGVVNVSLPDFGEIGFVGVEYPSIAYETFSWSIMPSESNVTFLVKDGDGNPLRNQPIDFSLSSNLNGPGQPQLEHMSAVSNADGIVTTRIKAGTLATSVRVLASHTLTDGTVVTTTSSAIAVNTGPVHYHGFSLYSNEYAPEAEDYVEGAILTVYATDKNGNPVADGTVVSFWAEYGQIGATCGTVDGSCSANWNSSGVKADKGPNPVPPGEDPGSPYDALVTIHAFTVGEDTFYSNGTEGTYELYDVGDVFVPVPERFFDRNFNFEWDAGFEEYIDYDGSLSYTAASDVTHFRGVSCSEDAILNGHCDQQGVEVWDQIQIVLADSSLVIVPSDDNFYGDNTFTFLLRGVNGHQAPTGTTVSVSADVGSAEILGGNTVLDGGRFNNPSIGVNYTGDIFTVKYTEGDANDQIIISATTPKGNESFTQVTALYDALEISTTPVTTTINGTGSFNVVLGYTSGKDVMEGTELAVETTVGAASFGGSEQDYVLTDNAAPVFTVDFDGAVAPGDPVRGFITVTATGPDGKEAVVRVEALAD